MIPKLEAARILHVAHAIPPEGNTGVENYTVAVAQAQAAAGHPVAVFTRGPQASGPKDIERRDEQDGVLTVRVPFASGHQFGHQRTRWDMADRFRKFIADWKPDVIHFQHLLYHSLDYPEIAKKAGAGTVLTLHDLWFTCPTVQRVDYKGRLCDRAPGRGCLPCVSGGRLGTALFRHDAVVRLADTPAGRVLDLAPTTDELADWLPNTRRCLRNIDVLISPSQFYARQLTERGITHPHLVITDCGVVRPEPVPTESERGLRFGLIGSSSLKGAAVAVEAFRKLPAESQAQLLLFGTPPEGDLPASVTVHGPYAASEIERVFGAFDVLLTPSLWYENAMLVIREAFARGKPVIASNLAGMAESICPGVDGLLFPVGDTDGLAACIRRLTEEPGLLDTLCAGIRSPKFFEAHVEELELLYTRARSQ